MLTLGVVALFTGALAIQCDSRCIADTVLKTDDGTFAFRNCDDDIWYHQKDEHTMTALPFRSSHEVVYSHGFYFMDMNGTLTKCNDNYCESVYELSDKIAFAIFSIPICMYILVEVLRRLHVLISISKFSQRVSNVIRRGERLSKCSESHRRVSLVERQAAENLI